MEPLTIGFTAAASLDAKVALRVFLEDVTFEELVALRRPGDGFVLLEVGEFHFTCRLIPPGTVLVHDSKQRGR